MSFVKLASSNLVGRSDYLPSILSFYISIHPYTICIMSIKLSIILSTYISILLSIVLSFYISIQISFSLSRYPSNYKSFYHSTVYIHPIQSIVLTFYSIYPSHYLSFCCYIQLTICHLVILYILQMIYHFGILPISNYPLFFFSLYILQMIYHFVILYIHPTIHCFTVVYNPPSYLLFCCSTVYINPVIYCFGVIYINLTISRLVVLFNYLSF